MSTLSSRNPSSIALRCPHCQHPVERIRRRSWMRWLPLSRHLDCPHCETRYLRYLGCWLGPL